MLPNFYRVCPKESMASGLVYFFGTPCIYDGPLNKYLHILLKLNTSYLKIILKCVAYTIFIFKF